MERQHILKCIGEYVRSNYDRFYYKNNKLEDLVFESLEWWPKDIKLYSNSGCKQVENKVDVLIWRTK